MKLNKKLLIILLFILLIILTYNCETSVDTDIKHEAAVVWSYPVPDKGFPEQVMPVIENGYTFVAADSTITCYELKTGKIIWKSEIGVGSRAIQSQRLLSSGNNLYLNHFNWVKAFDKTTGNLVWHTIIDNFRSRDLEIMSQNTSSLIVGGQGEVIKISKLTGNIELRIKLEELIPSGYFQLADNPVISDDGFIYVPTGWFTGTELKGNLLCYNSESGKYLWGFESPRNFDIQSCDIQDNLLVFASSSSMFALNRFTGKKIWETNVSDDAFWHSVTIDGESVFMGSTAQGRMYSFDLRNGKLKWRTASTQSSILTIITVANGRVYFCNTAHIYVLEAINGSIIWKGLPPENANDIYTIYSSPVAVGEGYMVCVGNKKVYCLTDP